MSWWTGDGHVTLPKPVIDLLAEAALALREEIIEEIIHDNPDLHVAIGVSVFDSLDPKTQVFALAYVLRHLSDAALPSPKLFAWNEGTAWAMFVKAGHELVMEIDLEEGGRSRDQVSVPPPRPGGNQGGRSLVTTPGPPKPQNRRMGRLHRRDR